MNNSSMKSNFNYKISSVELKKNIGLFLRKIRIDRSLTGKQLGTLLNISQQQVSRYERGISSLSFEKMHEILHVLDVNWNKFFSKVLNIDK